LGLESLGAVEAGLGGEEGGKEEEGGGSRHEVQDTAICSVAIC
jgi:hypothetical protein